MTALVIIACLHGMCRGYPAALPSGAGPMACMVEAQQIAAVFAAEHPALRVRGWRCGPERVRT